ncbi:MAG: HD domain-containing protein [Deltaproteobacteria bacterium]|jgi:hypothetical protein|nr:HD domain-containing protein [Deltaproteobacteria bacterium]
MNTDQQNSETLSAVAARYTYLPFVPGISLPEPPAAPASFSGSAQTDGADAGYQPAPTPEECFRLWDRYAVPPHIRDHCRQVALVLTGVGDLAIERGAVLSRSTLLSGGLLHDIAKMYTVHYPGNHAQIGAAVVLRETGNYLLSQMVYHHVNWPWEIDVYNDRILHVLLMSYADKRVMHDRIVSLEDRFADLKERYGHNERSLAMLTLAHRQAVEVEAALSRRLEVKINEYNFGSKTQ